MHLVVINVVYCVISIYLSIYSNDIIILTVIILVMCVLVMCSLCSFFFTSPFLLLSNIIPPVFEVLSFPELVSGSLYFFF